ncbi:MAG: hypothetical protein ACOX87_04610 [Chloroflexota bacterium]
MARAISPGVDLAVTMVGSGLICRLMKLAGALLALLTILGMVVTPSPAVAAPPQDDGWIRNSSYRIDFLGRDGPNSTDHYRVTLDWGATFFAIAVEAMPLLPAEQAVNILIDGYRSTFPERSTEEVHPGDAFHFYVAPGTLVCSEWRPIGGGAAEYRSLLGDHLILYTDPFHPLKYRLKRGGDTNSEEVMVNHEAEPEPEELAKTIFGLNDPSFKPDYLQIQRARDILANRIAVATIDTSREHIDDFLEIRDSGERGDKTEQGLQIYWFKPESTAQPVFRVDDGIGDEIDPNTFPSPSRVYYYKDGVIRTYQRVQDIAFLSGRQPQNEAWSKVYEEWGGLNPHPTRWEIGQPEQDAQAEELRRLGIAVLRFQPVNPPKGNFLTQFLDLLLSLMKREQG